jgi:hypothetical protein
MRIPKLVLLGATILLGQFTSSRLEAQAAPTGGHADASIAVRFGTLGIGLEVSKLLIGHVGVRVGANYFKYSKTRTQSDVTYDASLKLQAFSALIDLFPGNRGNFHFTGGLMTDPAKVTATGKPTASGTFTLNGNSYTTAQVGILTGEAKFPSVGPYAGIGFGTPAKNGGAIKFLFDIGAVIGKATVRLGATGAASNPTLAADLKAQQDKTEHDVQKYAKVYPVISFGLAYRF